MDLGDLQKLRQSPAAEVAADFDASPEARELLPAHATIPAFLDVLLKQRLWVDAIRLLSFALPARERVWWACLMARDSLAPDARQDMLSCIEAAEEWVYRPTDPARRAVFPLAEAIGFESPAAYAGLAAYWAEGSLAPLDMPPVPPSPALSPTAAAAAVLLSAVIRDPAKAEAKYRAAIAAAVNIANGGNGQPNKAA
jgi:hypothetical protein